MSSLEEMFEECDCSCHHEYGGLATVVHCVPCCQSCSYCAKKIRYNSDQHEKRCSLNPVNLIASWNEKHPETPLKCSKCGGQATKGYGMDFVCGEFPKCDPGEGKSR